MTARLEFIDDPSLPDGFVVISVTPPIAEGSDTRLSVTRKNADRPCLGPHGWQASDHRFTPLQVRQSDAETQLVFGQELSAHVAVDSDVTVTLPGQGIRERHFWPEIAAGADAGTLNIDLPEQRQGVKPQTGHLPTDGGTGNPGKGGDGEGGDGETGTGGTTGTGGGTGTTGGGTIIDSEIKERRRHWLIPVTIALVLLLAGVTATALYVFMAKSDEAQEQITTTDPPTPHTDETNLPPIVPPLPTPPTAPGLADRYRTYLAQQGHADELLALGREALAANETDVGFNAVTLSADRGSAAAKFLIGQWYDPGQSGSPTRPNPNNAANYYQQAATLNHPEAATALQGLCRAAAGEGGTVPDWAADFDMKTNCQ